MLDALAYCRLKPFPAGAKCWSTGCKVIAPYRHRTSACDDGCGNKLGGFSSVTMMYGTNPQKNAWNTFRTRDVDESPRVLVAAYLLSLRGIFSARWYTLGDEIIAANPLNWRKATGYDYLRTIAVARLLLDNIPSSSELGHKVRRSRRSLELWPRRLRQ